MNRIIINGKVIESDDNVSIIVNGDNVIIGGSSVDVSDSKEINITIEEGAKINKLETRGKTTIKGNVSGDMETRGDIECCHVGGNINARGNVKCGKVNGGLNVRGNVRII